MKLLIVGSALEGALEHHYNKYFNQFGVTSSIYDIHGSFIKDYQKSFYLKVLLHLKFVFFYHSYNEKLKKHIKSYCPTHVLVFKGMEIFPSTLIFIKEEGIRILNYNPDNPFLFSGIGSGNQNITNSISLYDAHFTYDKEIQSKLKEKFSLPVYLLPFGFEIPASFQYRPDKILEIRKICFLGNPDEFRASFVMKIAESGLPVDVFGNNWSKWVNHPNISCFGSVHGNEFWETLYKYRVQLNLMRPHNPNSHNMRSFEVPAIGGIMLAQKTPDHLHFFETNKEIFVFDSFEECIQTAKSLLTMSKEEADQIRVKAWDKSRTASYSYASRVQHFLEYVTKDGSLS